MDVKVVQDVWLKENSDPIFLKQNRMCMFMEVSIESKVLPLSP